MESITKASILKNNKKLKRYLYILIYINIDRYKISLYLDIYRS